MSNGLLAAAQVTFGIVVIVGANAAISAAGAGFAALVACNLALVLAFELALTGPADFQLGAGCFFALLIMLIISLYGGHKPVHDARFAR